MSGTIVGATPLSGGRCRFEVWAPKSERVEVHLVAPVERLCSMERDTRGYHRAVVEGAVPGARYFFLHDGVRDRPDPASRLQPEGVHGPSEVVDLAALELTDAAWHGRPLAEYVIYELHVGTFSADGTFDGVVADLDRLRDLGVTAIEMLPIAQFPGTRNWGYDGAALFAVQASYGGPTGLARLVDACHARGLCIVLDLVYNHLGPEGSYLGEAGPYFTGAYHTPWGPALDFDGPHSDEVRRLFVDNALMWVEAFHADALRLDAVHAILDRSPYPFLEELGARVHAAAARLGRQVHVIAESDANDPRLIRAPDVGGYGLDAVWADDLHHALHAALTGETQGYYDDYADDAVPMVARALREGFAYAGQYSRYRKRRHGRAAPEAEPTRFVVCSQNHDQVGNRLGGERLASLVGLEAQKLAAAVVLLSRQVPLLFMGEEWGETAPFLFFTSHGDPELTRAVREGRRREFAAFGWAEEPPDPQAPETFERSRLGRGLRDHPKHRGVEAFYRRLLELRHTRPAMRHPSRTGYEATVLEEGSVLFVMVPSETGDDALAIAYNFDATPRRVRLPLPAGVWERLLDSSWQAFGGPSEEAEPSSSPALSSEGTVEIAVGAHAVLVLGRAVARRRSLTSSEVRGM